MALRTLLAAALCSCTGAVNYQAVQPDLNVAVVGGGIGGALTALNLLDAGFSSVSLFELNADLLGSTSSKISATVNFDTYYREWKKAAGMEAGLSEAYRVFSDGWKINEGTPARMRWLDFSKNTAVETGQLVKSWQSSRNTDIQRRKVFRTSYETLVNLTRNYPELCTATIGQWCCEASDETRAVIEADNKTVCPESPDADDSPFGLFQLAQDPVECAAMQESANAHNGCDDPTITTEEACDAAGHIWRDVVYSYYDKENSLLRMGSYLSDDEAASEEWCSLVEHKMTGFVRTEVLFNVLTDIFANKSDALDLWTGCKVTKIAPKTQVQGSKIEVTTHKNCGLDGVREFDRVVVSANAASAGLLAEADAVLDRHLVPVKGYGLAGVVNDTSMVIDESGYARGIHYIDHSEEFQAAYARTTQDMRVKIWGGHDLDLSDDLFSSGNFNSMTDSQADYVFGSGPSCARELLALNTTQRSVGVRPVSSYGQVPIIKRYEGKWENVFINSGYGYNGYDLAWFSADCVAEWIATDEMPTSDACAGAVAVGPETSTSVMAIVYAIVGCIIALVVLLLPVCFLGGCCCWGRSKCARCCCCCKYDDGNICCVPIDDEDDNDDVSFVGEARKPSVGAIAGAGTGGAGASKVAETEFTGFDGV